MFHNKETFYLYLNHNKLFVVLDEKQWLDKADNGILIETYTNKFILETKAERINKKLGLI